jgi:hypothetical protein
MLTQENAAPADRLAKAVGGKAHSIRDVDHEQLTRMRIKLHENHTQEKRQGKGHPFFFGEGPILSLPLARSTRQHSKGARSAIAYDELEVRRTTKSGDEQPKKIRVSTVWSFEEIANSS